MSNVHEVVGDSLKRAFGTQNPAALELTSAVPNTQLLKEIQK
jgi:hypothetical protein